ncbi:LAFE_0E05886g1_1 [Lachancea fermentati]|uniref:LAFE_0E05886g1_1 n=1 Tax=Lachancea fermentati TaxID=4955 RepID=A0A1G4MD70_LACFM|nr:LAFE_0E05886g1_1 [Lachancea fermentati]
MSSTITSCFVVILSIIMMLLRNNTTFKQRLARKLENTMTRFNKHIPISQDFKLETSPYFKQPVGLAGIFDSLTQFQEYKVRALRQNGIIFHRTKELNSSLLDQLRELQYFDKLVDVNHAIEKNHAVTEAIIRHTLQQLVKNNTLDTDNGKEITSMIGKLGYQVTASSEVSKISSEVVLESKSNQGRVNEAISHICRDWHFEYEKERTPLINFINSRLDSLKGQRKTLVVFPGSGAGNLAYQIAKDHPNFEVHSIEFSSLMYLCNEFILGHNGKVTIAPYAQHYSGQEKFDFQKRDLELNLEKFHRPPNLKPLFGDFRAYTPLSDYDEIVVCSAYFIDTAENLFQYFEAVEQLCSFSPTIHWINIGPLKYGTRPLIQLSSEELAKLRKLRKWKDLYSECDTTHLNGYLTDEHSLYQGFYGLVKFHSVFTGN